MPLAALVLAVLSTASSEETLLRVGLPAPRPELLAALLEDAGFDVLHDTVDGRLQLIVSSDELALLAARGLDPVVLERGRPFRQVAAEETGAGEGDPPSGYLDLAGVEAAMVALAAEHPTLCQLVDVTDLYGPGPTVEGRHLFALRVSDNAAVDEDEPTVLVVSAHHCREIVTPVIALDTAERLLDGYGSDPRITAAVDGHEIWIAPMWNPDGYHHVFEVDNFWRKNRRVFPEGIGVDLNRNYSFGWSTACAGSALPSSTTYKGPGPSSEIETQTLVALSLDRRFAKILDYHSSGQEVLWGYSCLTHPLDAFLQDEAVALSTASGYGGDERRPSADGEHYHTQLALGGSHAFLVETATQFQPTYAVALAEAATVWPGVLWLLERPISVWGHVTDACTGASVPADVTVLDLDFENGEQNGAGGPFGRYHLFLPAGDYQIAFSATGYATATHDITVTDTGEVLLDVGLVPVDGCWTDLGGGSPGVAGVPQLAGSGPLVAGQSIALDLTSTAPSALVLLWLSTTSSPLSILGGTLHAFPFDEQLLLATDAAGAFSASTTFPPAVPPGTGLWFQFLCSDASVPAGITLSNGVRATTP